ncbi:DUF2867 domain-containing protein [Achromobacter deleyi]|uniref:DUF2867 domain-containing protein n=1 Tax=Achromobacter deleyi TaxID=1353891 RepID=UPI001490A167|nr:DUF2867 domain-containing protein [Achromobacter deleyi]QVQ27734.1 DUF2867 domain-containing protein [Achromobacter deleyi]UIP23336.1 DUF2867 domain-containing protein [Achromobacter deleyi]
MHPSLACPATLPMRATRRTETFPFVALPTGPTSVPIEVSLIARLGHGAGTKLFHDMLARQRRHHQFIDALDEPSAKLGSSDFAKGDATALYSFGVDNRGHPFHLHAGHRIFTAISGSGGAQLRFSSATLQELDLDPASFIRGLHFVEVPPDCLFTVRFPGGTWHQFLPLAPDSGHPAFFALSTHTNELGGPLSDQARRQVLEGKGDIPSLTQLLPDAVAGLLERCPIDRARVPTIILSLDEQPGKGREVASKRCRSAIGHIRALLAPRRSRPGFVSQVAAAQMLEQRDLPASSLLLAQLSDRTVHHQDRFTLTVSPLANQSPPDADAGKLLEDLLGSFLAHPHAGVTRLMALRNLLTRPFRLRTSPLACPVSSLLAETSPHYFAGHYPVHAWRVSADRRTAQVILGADDRHLVFRSCVEVAYLPDGRVEFALSTRVACNNLPGRIYLALISCAHRRYIAPRLLQSAVESLLAARWEAPSMTLKRENITTPSPELSPTE